MYHFRTVITLCLITLCSWSFAQSYTVTKNSITFNLEKVAGIGPSGNHNIGISSYDEIEEQEARAYPVMRNIPTGLSRGLSYYYLLDPFQFYYQNYRAGIYSKTFFLDQVGQYKWPLADTTSLSAKPVKCGIFVMAGYSADNELVYIADANNNGDLGDDVLRPAAKRFMNNRAAAAIPIDVEFSSGKLIKKEKLSVVIINDNDSQKEKTQTRILFGFPEFRYASFTYNGESYFICTDMPLGTPSISVIPDRPVFDRVPAESQLKLGQFIPVGNRDIKFTGYKEQGNKITFSGKDLRGFLTLAPKVGPQKKLTDTRINYTVASPVSSQAGFMAPTVKGYNINTMAQGDSLISTADLKGKYVFIDFWSSNCIPCIQEFPNLKAAYQKFGRKNFEIIGVLDERDPKITSKLISEGNMIWPTIKTSMKGTDVAGYNIYSYPTSYLLNPDGKVIAMNLRGEELMETLSALIKP